MDAVVLMLKSWFLVNWKTTAMGLIAAVEIYQATHSAQAALTAFLTGLFMSDAKAGHVLPGSPPAPTTQVRTLVPLFLAIAVAVLVLAAPRAARADSSPGGPLAVCLNEGCSFRLAPSVAVSGSAYDFSTKTIVRSVQFAGLVEFQWDASPVALAVGGALQTGDQQGVTAAQFLTFPKLPGMLKDLAIGAHETFWGETPSVVAAVGYVTRF